MSLPTDIPPMNSGKDDSRPRSEENHRRAAHSEDARAAFFRDTLRADAGPVWIIRDRDEARGRSRHVGCAPESESTVRGPVVGTLRSAVAAASFAQGQARRLARRAADDKWLSIHAKAR